MRLIPALILVFVLLLLISRAFYSRQKGKMQIEMQLMFIFSMPLLGYLLGPGGFGIFDVESQVQIHPVVHLSLGWLGLYSGLFLGWQDIRRYTRAVLLFSLQEGLFTFSMITIVVLALLSAFGLNFFDALLGSLALGIAGTELSPMALTLLRNRFRDKSSFGFLVQSLAAMSGIISILLLGIVSPILSAESIFHYLLLLLFELLLGIILGLITVYVIHTIRHSQEFLIWLIAMLFISSGIAFYLRFNAIFMNFVLGSMIATFSMRRSAARRILEPLEEPAYFFLLLFAGLSLQVSWLYLFVGAAAFFGHFISKDISYKIYFGKDVIGSQTANYLKPAKFALGNLSIAVGINLLMLTESLMARQILGALTVQYVVSYLLFWFAARRIKAE
ncbi:MAG TPA: hypothetical protein ENN84_10140 [Candidatus Marinimicrobia bacterium]|nr:hypothetical protein [Candidatus Neomarinimicrobiota bacterium]